MSTAYFDVLNTCPTFLVQSVDVTFFGQNKVYMVCAGLHPVAPRCSGLKRQAKSLQEEWDNLERENSPVPTPPPPPPHAQTT